MSYWLVLKLCLCCAAQQPAPSSGPVSSVQVNVNRVLVPVVVRNRQGQTVGDLNKEDFTVLDNDEPRAISGFVVEQRGTGATVQAGGAATADVLERARQNLTEAGLMDLVEIGEGDALQTIAHDLPDTMNLVILDGAKCLYMDILECVDERLYPGSLMLADDTNRCPDYVQSIRAHAHKYLSVPLRDDVELSMRLS
jgi:hypothetical protein